MTSQPVLTVEDLSVSFRQRSKGQEVISNVVKQVSFDLYAGETLGLVGESGSGKSLTALSILQLLPYPQAFHPSGSVRYQGTELVNADPETLQRIRGNDISMIFQEPMTALNPLHVIEKQIAESLSLHQGITGDAAQSKIIELLDQVGIHDPETRLGAYPHQLSGGQRQRVMIAMALANQPEVLLADEPTTALDVTVQARILALLKQLQVTNNLGILLITHDLNMVRKVADRVLVMQDGRMVERGTTSQIFTSPKEPYTRVLLSAEPNKRTAPDPSSETIIEAEHLKVWFPIRRGILKRTVGYVKAVNDASLALKPGHTLGIVGESGSGKTTLALALLRLVKSEGKVTFLGRDMNQFAGEELKAMRRELQMVFQDPYGSLSPRMSITDIVSEGLDAHGLMPDPRERDQRVVEILKEVEIDPEVRFRYPHEFSGGQRQRIAIARALILEPKVLFLDEPTSALDRTVQVQVLELLNRLQRLHNLSYVFISHDLSVIRALADELMVMKSGDVVEQGDAEKIFADPQNDYTRTLLDAAFNLAA
ncbi:MAG: ABC transporter ATP-binding protein [Arenicellales bacterium]